MKKMAKGAPVEEDDRLFYRGNFTRIIPTNSTIPVSNSNPLFPKIIVDNKRAISLPLFPKIEEDLDSLLLPLLVITEGEIPLFRVLHIIYTYYNMNPLLQSNVMCYSHKIKQMIKNNFKVISVCFVIVLSVLLI